jgi:hypothetical protein
LGFDRLKDKNLLIPFINNEAYFSGFFLDKEANALSTSIKWNKISPSPPPNLLFKALRV